MPSQAPTPVQDGLAGEVQGTDPVVRRLTQSVASGSRPSTMATLIALVLERAAASPRPTMPPTITTSTSCICILLGPFWRVAGDPGGDAHRRASCSKCRVRRAGRQRFIGRTPAHESQGAGGERCLLSQGTLAHQGERQIAAHHQGSVMV